jgi:hypothetical protein
LVRPSIEVADIFAAHAGAFVEGRGVVSSATRRVLHDLSVCRTAALGGHIERCDSCDYEQVAYNSCLMGSAGLWGVACRKSGLITVLAAFLSP